MRNSDFRESDLQQATPVVYLSTSIGRFALTYFNSMLYGIGSDPLNNDMSHLWFSDDKDGQHYRVPYRFLGITAVDELYNSGFPCVYLPIPPASEREAYEQSETEIAMLTLDKELGEL